MSSMLYTVGTALNRAHDNDVPVQILVEGQWLEGSVVALDGHGVVLDLAGLEHSVIKMERVSAVRIQAAAPNRQAVPASTSSATASGDHGDAGPARPMPGPRGET